MNGDIIYIEMALKDVSTTIHFYETVFGWTFKQSFLSKQTYYMFETPGKTLAGGFDGSFEPSNQGVLIYLSVTSITQTLKRIQEVCEDVVILKEKTLVSEEYGSYALLVDPSGNRIGLQED